MQPQVTFRGLFPSQPLVDTVCSRARALASFAPEIESCHVFIERLGREGAAKPRFRVSLLVSGSAPSVATQPSSPHSVTAVDVQQALREVFAHARRRFAQPWLLPRPGSARVSAHH